MGVDIHMDALVIQTWGQKVDAAIIPFPLTVQLTAPMVLILPAATVIVHAIFLMTVVRTFLKLNALVSYFKACIIFRYMYVYLHCFTVYFS